MILESALSLVLVASLLEPPSTIGDSITAPMWQPSFPSPAYGGYLSLDSDRELRLWSDLSISSNSLPVRFAYEAWRRGYLDDMKQSASDGLKPSNRIGAHFVSGVDFHMKFKKDWAWSVGVKQSRMIGIRFPKDMFDLVFFGNAKFENMTAEFAPSDLFNITYNQFLLGVSRQYRSGEHRFVFGAEVSATAGAGFQQISVTRGTLFTATDGEYVDLDVAFSSRFSDTARGGSFVVNGGGLGLNLMLAHYSPFEMTVAIQDIGFIGWSKNSLSLSADTTVHFEGFDANQFFEQPDSFFIGIEDSLRQIIGLDESMGTTRSGLPGRMTISVGHHVFGARGHVAGGVSFPISSLMPIRPLVFAKGTVLFRSRFSAGCTLSYGGYGDFNVGLEGGAVIKQRLAIVIGAPSVPGLILPGSLTSSGLWAAASVSL